MHSHKKTPTQTRQTNHLRNRPTNSVPVSDQVTANKRKAKHVQPVRLQNPNRVRASQRHSVRKVEFALKIRPLASTKSPTHIIIRTATVDKRNVNDRLNNRLLDKKSKCKNSIFFRLKKEYS
jgi:hypothetical protein